MVRLRGAFTALAALSFAAFVFAGGADLGSADGYVVLAKNRDGLPFGADPGNGEAYRLSAFTCDEGVTTLDTDRVNDDYCDCADGTDEPGTSACSNGSFHCSNRGAQSESIPSSRVNDGVCDCCDGGDERYGGRVTCANTCSDAGASRRDELVAQVQDTKMGLARKKNAIDSAPAERKRWLELKQKLTKDVAAAAAKTESARETERSAREASEKANELVVQFNTVAHAVDATSRQDDTSEGNGDSRQGSDAGEESKDESKDSAEEASSDSSEIRSPEIPPGETDEERGQRIAKQWIKSDSESTTGDTSADDEAVTGETEKHRTKETPLLLDVDDDGEATDGGKTKKSFFSLGNWFAGKGDGKTTVQSSEEKAARAKLAKAATVLASATTALTAAEKKQKETQAELTKVELDLSRFVGPSAEYQHMLGACYAAKIDKYSYTVCPFGEAKQDGTKLGVMEPLEPPDTTTTGSHTTFRFTNGEHCWNGPKRSIAVSLACAGEPKLGGVTEPSRCEYHAVLTTPAACDDAQLVSLESELRELEVDVAEAAAEARGEELR